MPWDSVLYVYLLRILLAGFCGIIIGAERQYRLKTAGIKTHFMVIIATTLMMIVSKYGFLDLANISGVSYDSSRVAAGIITGIGMLGGGMIITGKRGNVSGLTTATGMWVTVAIGMAIGAGMCVLGMIVTVGVLIAQFIFHCSLFTQRKQIRAVITYDLEKESIDGILEHLDKYAARINSLKVNCTEESDRQLECRVIFAAHISQEEAIDHAFSCGKVASFEIIA